MVKMPTSDKVLDEKAAAIAVAIHEFVAAEVIALLNLQGDVPGRGPQDRAVADAAWTLVEKISDALKAARAE